MKKFLFDHPFLLLALILTPIALVIFFIFHYLQTWPLRYRSQLNDFFGKGNWSHVATSTKETHLFMEDSDQPGRFHEWTLEYTNPYGETATAKISDLTLKANHQKRGFLSKKRLSQKQALNLELLDVGRTIAEAEIRREILQKVLPEPEADCLQINVMVHDTNSPPKIYDQLPEEPWFAASRIRASDLLQTTLFDVHIDLTTMTYPFDQLSPSQQEHFFASIEPLEQRLQEYFGAYTDYVIDPLGSPIEFRASKAEQKKPA